MNAPASTPRPETIFRWDHPRRPWGVVLLFLAGSLAAHAFCFYLFRISYPPAMPLLPAPARLQVIDGNTEEGRAFLRWLEAEDPALASTTLRPPGQKAFALPSPAHQPSYAGRIPSLQLPEYGAAPASARPDPFPPGPVPRPSLSRAPAPVAGPTSILLGPEAGGERRPAGRVFASAHPGTPANARFRFAFDNHGIIRHIFREESSGDAALDEQARALLVGLRLPASAPGRETLIWSEAVFLWGNDLQPALPAAPPVGKP